VAAQSAANRQRRRRQVTAPTLALTVSASDDHWLGRVVMTIGVAMSSATVALPILLLIGGR
jgi:hypothetical protein